MKQCHQCGASWESEKRQPGFKELCEKCSAFLHCCLNCRFHDRGRHNECIIPNTDWVGDRSGLNFCEEFEFRSQSQQNQALTEGDEARDRFDALFGGTDNDDSTPPTLDNLFGN